MDIPLPKRLYVLYGEDEIEISSPLVIKLLRNTNDKSFHDRMILKAAVEGRTTWGLLHLLESWIKRGKQYKRIAFEFITELGLEYGQNGFSFEDKERTEQQELLMAVREYVEHNSRWKVQHVVNHIAKKKGFGDTKARNALNELFLKLLSKRVL